MGRENAAMTHQANCPVCGILVHLPDDLPGRCLQCVACRANLMTTTGGQLIAQAQLSQPSPPTNPFADTQGGFSYPGNYAPAPFAPGYLPTPISREAALAKVQGPGLLLQISGVLIMLVALASLLLLLVPEASEDELPLVLGV